MMLLCSRIRVLMYKYTVHIHVHVLEKKGVVFGHSCLALPCLVD